MISLFGKKEPSTKIYFTKGDKVTIGSNTVLENAFQVGNFYNLLQNAKTEGNVKAYKYNLLLTLNKLQLVEQAKPVEFTELLECIYIKDYKHTSTKFCDLLVKLYPTYFKK